MTPFARTQQLLGKEALDKIGQARVAVFGLGAVGSYATEALARAGVGYLRLVDFDTVDASNINRQLFALHSTIGKAKATVAGDRVRDIHPFCELDLHPSFVNAESLTDLLSEDITVVVDAIDGLNSKVNLLFGARQMGLPVVASMGAAGRTDPGQIRAGDISETQVCPLARVVRRRLHRRGVFSGIRCVYSVEKPLNKQGNESGEGPDTGDLTGYAASTGHGRRRPPIGTIPWIPGIFGLMLAHEAVSIITR